MKTFGLSILAILFTHSLFSQDSDSLKARSFTVSGFADGYYRYDFRNPKSAPYNSLTSFTRASNSFELGMASLRAEHKFGKVSATLDLGFGTRAREFAYNDEGTNIALKQLYVTYAPSQSLKFAFGTWATHVGYEMLDPYLNRNYSMSYMFTNGPLTHTGLKADFRIGEKSGIMIGISNPTDYRSAPAMPKSFIAQFSTGSKDDRFKTYLNFVAGKQSDYKKLAQGDIVGSYAMTDEFTLGLNATLKSVQLDADSSGKFSSSNWSGAAIYLNYDPMQWLGLTLRTEYINDRDEFLGFKSMIAHTLSANFRIDNLTIIPEFRLDNAGNKVFYKSANGMNRSTANFILAATYHF